MPVRWFPPGAAVIGPAAQRALLGAGEVLLEEANRTVPHLEGTLEDSGNVEADETHAVISYDTPYAVRQHEDVTLRHADGRRAKWLQLTMQEHAPRVVEWLSRRLAEVFR